MTREETKKLMKELKDTYQDRFYKNGVTSNVVTLWAVALANVSYDDALIAIGKHMQNSVFAPMPKEIIEIAERLHDKLYFKPCPEFKLEAHHE